MAAENTTSSTTKLALDMQALREVLNAITPIDGFSILDGAVAEIGYLSEVTEAQQAQVAAAIARWPLECKKRACIQQLDTEWQNKVKIGWASPAGWKLGLDISDVTLLTGAFMLAKEAANMGIDAPAHVIDTAGVTHELPLAALTTLMLSYGQARAALSAADAATRHAINAAATLDQLNAISICTT